MGLLKGLPVAEAIRTGVNVIAGMFGQKFSEEERKRLAAAIDEKVAHRLAEERAVVTEELRALRTVVRALVILVVILVLAVLAIAVKLFFLK
ncbi:MAG: hypothetical protein AABZ39_06425 [Spirochaetota bacterium]